MRIDYHIDLSGTLDGVVRVKADFSGVPAGTGLLLPVMGQKPGVKVTGLSAAIRGGTAVRPRVTGELIRRPGAAFSLEYAISIRLKHSIGTDKDSDLLYPFLNEDEIFLASGALPYPEDLPRLASRIKASMRVTGLPDGFKVFSSVEGPSLCPGQLDSFFIYCSSKSPADHVYYGKRGATRLSLLVQKGKRIPLNTSQVWRHTDKVMRELERSFSPYGGVMKVGILVLQAPADFERVAGGRTFATGENVPGGVLVYAPAAAGYIRKNFGHSGYASFLRDGLAHELTHFYFTAAWQGRYKSLLFPAGTCPPRHKRLLGETLTLYFHRAIIGSRDGKASFLAGEIRPRLAAWEAKPSKSGVLDLLLLDLWLREGGSSLRNAVRSLIRKYGTRHKPYPSARALTQAAEQSRRAALPSWLRRTILGDHSPDYIERLKELSFSRDGEFNPCS